MLPLLNACTIWVTRRMGRRLSMDTVTAQRPGPRRPPSLGAVDLTPTTRPDGPRLHNATHREHHPPSPVISCLDRGCRRDRLLRDLDAHGEHRHWGTARATTARREQQLVDEHGTC